MYIIKTALSSNTCTSYHAFFTIKPDVFQKTKISSTGVFMRLEKNNTVGSVSIVVRLVAN